MPQIFDLVTSYYNNAKIIILSEQGEAQTKDFKKIFQERVDLIKNTREKGVRVYHLYC